MMVSNTADCCASRNRKYARRARDYMPFDGSHGPIAACLVRIRAPCGGRQAFLGADHSLGLALARSVVGEAQR